MNTRIHRLFTSLFLFAFVLSSCGVQAPGNNQISLPEKSFTDTSAWTPDAISAALGETPLDMQELAGVFSLGSFSGRDAYTMEYMHQRTDYVQQVEEQQRHSAAALKTALQEIKVLRSTSAYNLLFAASLFPESRDTILQEAANHVHIALMNTTKFSLIESTLEARDQATDQDNRAILSHLLLAQTADLTEGIRLEMAAIYTMEQLIEDRAAYANDTGMKAIAATWSQNLQDASGPLARALSDAHQSQARVLYGTQVLASADYSYAMDALAYLEKELPLQKERIEKDIWSSFVTEEDKTLVRLSLTEAEERLLVLKEAIKNTDASKLLPTPKRTSQVSFSAHAGFSDTMSWFGGKLKDAAVGAKDIAAAGASMTWNGVKATAGVVKDVAIVTAKTTGQIVGTAIETVDATMKSTLDTGISAYYGEPPSKIFAQVKQNYSEAFNRVKNGKAGANVYTDAKKMMEGAENAVGDLAQKTTEKIIGPGIISTTTGFLAKTTTGFFTGLAKDSYDVLNPDASEEDTLMGMFGLALTAVGGSGSAAKPTNLLKDGAKTTKNLFTAGKQFLTNLSPTKISGGLKEFFKDGVAAKVGSLFTPGSLKNALGTLDDVARSGASKAKGLLDDGYNALHGKITKDIPEAWKGLFEKKGFGEVLDTVFGTTGDTPREWLTGYLENVILSAADDQIKNGTRSALQYFSSPENTTASEAGSVLSNQIVHLSLPLTPKERLKAATEAVQTVQEQEESSMQGLSDELKKAILDALKQRLDELTEPPVAQFAGVYNSTFPFSFTVSGLRSTGTIDLHLTANNTGEITCSFNATQNVSGSYQGIAIHSSGKGKSTSCNGTVSDTGGFSIQGGASGFSTSTVMGQSYSGGSSVGFSASGQLEAGSTMHGTFSAGGYSFEF
ncbi:hypothetical protein COW46_01205 [Candidatus Gracilibacteria bacterium CG17_big_fil_post_rev_8_21_14_2_50_48_13]|nr:MAG: hypothetical protein COW46_01205 [Candidatus Gracilibacteria bacterium CG17_big_fil_post_rev_8_21_14_2_50_48_13]